MTAAEFLARASLLVAGDRERTHGPKARNHRNIAEMWSAYLRIRREPGSDLSAADVAKMMVLLKIARDELGEPNPDDPMDAIGYAAIWGELQG